MLLDPDEKMVVVYAPRRHWMALLEAAHARSSEHPQQVVALLDAITVAVSNSRLKDLSTETIAEIKAKYVDGTPIPELMAEYRLTRRALQKLKGAGRWYSAKYFQALQHAQQEIVPADATDA